MSLTVRKPPLFWIKEPCCEWPRKLLLKFEPDAFFLLSGIMIPKYLNLSRNDSKKFSRENWSSLIFSRQVFIIRSSSSRAIFPRTELTIFKIYFVGNQIPETDLTGIMRQLSVNSTPTSFTGSPNKAKSFLCSSMGQSGREPGFMAATFSR